MARCLIVFEEPLLESGFEPVRGLREVFFHITHVLTLQQCKAVCKAWQRQGRAVATDVNWMVASGISLHTLIKVGRPSPKLASKLALARPELLNERDRDEGLLPLQYAAAYRLDANLVSSLRTLTQSFVPGGLQALDRAAFSRKKAMLRSVETHIGHIPMVVDA